MDDELTTQQKMARFASPLIDERSPKRSRTSLEPEDAEKALTIIDVIADGDALLVLKSLSTAPDTQVGLRVSSFAMSMASQVFKTQFATATQKREEEPKIVLALLEEDGDAVFTICNIIHFRNDKLPTHVSADQLHSITLFAETYKCKVAVNRSTTQWFDQLYQKNTSSQADLCKIVEAACLLDEAVWFARFTSRWVLNSSLLNPSAPQVQTVEGAKVGIAMVCKQSSADIRLRADFDTLVDVAVRCFSHEYKHYIDWAPQMSPDPSETPTGKPPVNCRVDGDGGQEFLGALRDAHVWPSDVWFREGEDNKRMSEEEANAVSVAKIMNRFAEFILPDYDDADRCEFCDGIKEEFAAAVKSTKQAQKERLWGMCLDCFNAGGTKEGECRFDHPKPHQEKKVDETLRAEAAKQVSQQLEKKEQEGSGLGIEGL